MVLVTRRYLPGRMEVKLSSQRCLDGRGGRSEREVVRLFEGTACVKAQRTERQQGICNMQIVACAA